MNLLLSKKDGRKLKKLKTKKSSPKQSKQIYERSILYFTIRKGKTQAKEVWIDKKYNLFICQILLSKWNEMEKLKYV